MSISTHSVPATELRMNQLAASRQRLVKLLCRIHFGRIEGLNVMNGEPVFEPPPRVTRTLKMSQSQNQPRAQAADFVLKQEVIALLEHLAQIGNGVVERIEVAHGLPLHLEVRDSAAA